MERTCSMDDNLRVHYNSNFLESIDNWWNCYVNGSKLNIPPTHSYTPAYKHQPDVLPHYTSSLQNNWIFWVRISNKLWVLSTQHMLVSTNKIFLFFCFHQRSYFACINHIKHMMKWWFWNYYKLILYIIEKII